MLPKLEIRAQGILHNIRALKALAARRGIALSFVTKGLVADERLMRMILDGGVDSVCESRVQNLEKLFGPGGPLAQEPYAGVEKWLIRTPLPSDAADVVRYADVSLNSERVTLEALSGEALKQGRAHKVVLMAELGELREGALPEELIELCKVAESLPGVELHGIGANLSCLNAIVPDERNMGALALTVREAEAQLGRKLACISGGSTSTVRMLEEGTLPPEINHLRLGEAMLIGNVACYDVPFAGARTDNFLLTAEVIEVKEKPAVPWGCRIDAPTGAFVPVGKEGPAVRKRALIGVGYQDMDIRESQPLEPGLVLVDGTSDCFVCDVTDCPRALAPGDFVRFSLKYHAMVQAMAVDSVEKVIVE
ncbi:MAG: alanine racemase [Clostridiales Family XIII bacterium]|jgi:predicted amino acid racemase|nr:alanine racemase [Clostridiales Family XIII bacterium]